MPYVSNPIEHARDYDAIELAGQEFGGLVIVKGFKRPFGWDIKKGKGVKGGTLTLGEFPPAKGTITFVLWLPEHWRTLADITEAFNYDPSKKKSSPIDVYHPDLARLEINSIVCENIGGQENMGKGKYQIAYDVIEYLPPPPKDASATPNGSKTNNPKKTPGKTDDPIADAQQKRIAQLLKEAKE